MIQRIDECRLVLQAENVHLGTGPLDGGAMTTVNFHLCGGELALVYMEHPEQGTALADVFSGLIRPEAGTVLFLGRDWSRLPPDNANALRGKIGRVFSKGAWLNHLSMWENLLLPQRHHTRRSDAELHDEAMALADRFGLPGLPSGRPVQCLPADLQRGACIRAFLGRPVLILLEDPTAGGETGLMAGLINTIRNARDYGAAVVWMTSEESIWRDMTFPASFRYRFVGRQLMEVPR